MIDILNDLNDYCKDCPNMILTLCESLGSGKLAYTCKYKRICEHCVEMVTNMRKVESAEPQESKKSEDKQTEKSCDNCSKRHECAGFIEGNYWCWRPEESEDKQTEKSCDNCAMEYKCLGSTKRFRHFYGEYWCWKPKESEE